MSKWEKLIYRIIKEDASLRFNDLSKALENMGYVKRQPRKGSSHYTFVKKGRMPITIPKHKNLNKVYVILVSEIVMEYLKEESNE